MRIVRRALLVLALAALSTPALAQERPEGAVRSASKKFADGERAYRAGDYTLAGDSFESAYALAPHADALWNAARAWHSAAEYPRAANLYARFLREAAPSAPDRNSATTALVQLSKKLGKIELQRSTFDTARVDDHVIDSDTLYVAPGRHEVALQQGEERDVQSISLGAGAVISVAFHKPPVAAPTPTAISAPAPPPATERNGWSPAIVWIGAGLTVAAAGFSVWSGVDTLSARDDFRARPTQEGFEDGESKQLRTNIGWIATGTLAALTAVTAFALVDWQIASPRTRVAAGPGSVFVRTSF